MRFDTARRTPRSGAQDERDGRRCGATRRNGGCRPGFERPRAFGARADLAHPGGGGRHLNLSVANVALPSIGRAFDSSQTTLDLIAVGYSLGLAASVLWLGALGDRYGRKLLLVLGVALSVPACLLAAYATSDGVLIVARLLGGFSAGRPRWR
jgi:MFS family permease